MGAATIHIHRLTKMDGSPEVPIRVVVPYPVSEFVGTLPGMLPNAQTDVTGPRIDVRIVNLRSAGIPYLVRFLNGLIVDDELDVPEPDDVPIAALGFVRLNRRRD